MTDTQGIDDSLRQQPFTNLDEYQGEVSHSKRGHRVSSTPSSLSQESAYISKHIESSEPQCCGEYPTLEERALLRRVSDPIPWQSYLIAFIELTAQFSFYGCTVVFTNFIQQPLPPESRSGAGGSHGQSGALGMGQRASTGLTNFNYFWVYVTPLFGAFLADTYWGRYRTVCVAVVIALVGNALLIASAIPTVIEKPHVSLVIFVIAVVVMGIGTGGMKSCIAPLVAEQYRKTRLTVKLKEGERIIVDPALTTSRIFMYFYLLFNVGALFGVIVTTSCEKYVGFWLAYTVPTLALLVASLILLFGRHRLVDSPPQSLVLPTAIRVWRTATSGRWSINPITTWKRMNKNDFWEAAKPSVYLVQSSSMTGINEQTRRTTWDDQWVEEVRRGFKACKVFLWYPIYWLTYSQLNTNLVSQAATMRTNNLPNDVVFNLDSLTLIIFIPICDFFIYPAISRFGWRLTPLRKITLGFLTGAFAMFWAAVVQHFIYKSSPCGYSASTCTDSNNHMRSSNLSVWVQSGSYICIAISEILASITGLEYAFTKAPRHMRSLVFSVFFLMSAISSAIGEALVSLSQDPLLVWNYATMGVLAAITGVLFWYAHRDLDAEEDSLNELDAGRINIYVDSSNTDRRSVAAVLQHLRGL